MVLSETAAIDVWWLDPAEVPDDGLARVAAGLPEEDQAELSTITATKRRREVVLARALTRRAIAARTGVDARALRFAKTPEDRPYVVAPTLLVDRALDFNVTHTDGLVACAVASGLRVGIDAEALDARPVRLDLASELFAEDELAELRALPEEAQRDRFFRLWTHKEAYLKASGRGLLTPLNGFSFSFVDGSAAITFHPGLSDRPEHWVFRSLALRPRYSTVLAITFPSAKIEASATVPALGIFIHEASLP